MKDKRNLHIVLIFCIVLVVFVVGAAIYYQIFKPSYRSYVGACSGLTDDELGDIGILVLGRTIQNGTDISIQTSSNPVTIRHELCHAKQAVAGRFYPCERPVFHFMNEAECYSLEHLPIWNDEIAEIQGRIENGNN